MNKTTVIKGLVCVGIGIAIGLFVIPRKPDVKTITKTEYVNKYITSTSYITITEKSHITGATVVTIEKDGTQIIAGNLTFDNELNKVSDKDTSSHIVSNNTYKEKDIMYNGSVSLLWNGKFSGFDVTYTLINPVFIEGIYDWNDKKAFLGIGLKF